MSNVDIAVSVPTLLGECPAWDERQQALYWVDIEGKKIHRHDPATGGNETRATDGRPGSFVLTSDPDVLLVAMENELRWFHWPSGATKLFIAIEPAGNENRLNDGKTDRAGRYIVGSMYENPNAGVATGTLYSVEGDGAVRSIRSDIGVANGLAFDPLLDRAYFADTHTRRIERYGYDTATGQWNDESCFFDYADHPGLPDGACIDSEGHYWSASVYGWGLIRLSPEGKIVDRIEVPVEKPSMPALGGADYRTMYITTIGMGGGRPSAEGRDGAVPGSLFSVRTEVPGLAEVPFAGTPPAFAPS